MGLSATRGYHGQDKNPNSPNPQGFPCMPGARVVWGAGVQESPLPQSFSPGVVWHQHQVGAFQLDSWGSQSQELAHAEKTCAWDYRREALLEKNQIC